MNDADRFEAWMQSQPAYSAPQSGTLFVRNDMREAFKAGLKEARDGMSSKLIDTYIATTGKPVPWKHAVLITGIVGKLSEEEIQRLIDLDREE